MRFLLLVLTSLVLYIISPYASDKKDPCKNTVDVAIVLAVDVSQSIDEIEWSFQMQGYVKAFRDKTITSAIQSGFCKRIAVAMIEWGDISLHKTMISWRVLSNAESATRFANELDAVTRISDTSATSITGGLSHAITLFEYEHMPFTPIRKIIDISGDGSDDDDESDKSGMPYDTGRPRRHSTALLDIRTRAMEQDITINGLPILSENNTLDAYYRENVISHDGFIEVANKMENFAQAILRKLVQEITTASR